MADNSTNTITFLFTDIEGSTRLWEQYPDAMKVTLERHDLLLRDIIQRHSGQVFKTVGDAFYAAFTNAPDALAAALNAQKSIQSENWPTEIGTLRIRMALHTGTAVERDGDYFGPPLNRVARLLSAGHGGQTLLSVATQELVRDQLPAKATLLDLGEHRLKDLFRPERIYQLNTPEIPDNFPPLRTLDAKRTNLPAQPTPFVGRDRELTAVLALMRRPDVRMVTLTGAGGTGKTRLSLQAAADLLDEYEHGVIFVELATITDPNSVIPKVASTLDVKEVPGQPIEQTLQAELKDKQLLLVLDNLEQVVNCAPKLGDLLAATSALKIITSSREKLRLRAEHEYTVPPLGLPNVKKKETVAVVSQYEAVALFIQRAKAASDRWEITDENAHAVAEICVRLDGLPLAIELAAARSKVLTPQAILDKLSDRLKTLTGGARDLPARQQTIQGAIDWSYDLLDDTEKTLFARLGVFVGGCTLEAAEAVCGEGSSVEVFDGLESLVDKSLVSLTEDAANQTRFDMLETIYEYAAEKLGQLANTNDIRMRHTDFFVALAEWIDLDLRGSNQRHYLDIIDGDLDNLRAVDDRAFEERKPEACLKLVKAMVHFWRASAQLSEGRRRLERALAISEGQPASVMASAYYSFGRIVFLQNDLDSAQLYCERAIDLYRSIDDEQGPSWALYTLGNTALNREDFPAARAAFEESTAIARRFGDRHLLSRTLAALAIIEIDSLEGDLDRARAQLEEVVSQFGDIVDLISKAIFVTNIAGTHYFQSDYEHAQARFEQALSIARSIGWQHGTRGALWGLGNVAIRKGNFVVGHQLHSEALSTSLQADDKVGLLWSFLGLAVLAAVQGQPRRSATLRGACDSLRLDFGFTLSPREHDDYDRDLAAARAQLSPADFDKAWAEGQALSVDEAVQLALSPY